MAFRSAEVTVTTSPTLLLTAVAGDVEMWVNPDSSSTEYYLGGSSVTTTDGLHLFGRDPFNSHIRPGDSLYAVVASGTANINVLVRSA